MKQPLFLALLMVSVATWINCGGTPLQPNTALIIVPSATTLQADQTQQFTAVVTGATNTAVSWSVSSTAPSGTDIGNIDQTGLYKAPQWTAQQISVTVMATSVVDPTVRATATITVVVSTFIPYPGNPVLSPTVGESYTAFSSVVKVGSTYHMYYLYNGGQNAGQIGHATSSDGLSWTTDVANNPVLAPSVSGWDSAAVGVPIVWVEDATWNMLYRGYPTQGPIRGGYATSTDGIHWTRWSGNNCPGTTGNGCVLDVGITPGRTDSVEPCFGVTKLDGLYYLSYSNQSSPRQIGMATSTDLTTWTKDPNNPIFTGGRFCPNTFKYGGLYYMVVPHYTLSGSYAEFELYSDVNPTFYPADRSYLGVVKQTSTTGWDSVDEDTPFVLTDDVYRDSFNASNGDIWMYYAGTSTIGAVPWDTGLLMSSTGTAFSISGLTTPLTLAAGESTSLTVTFAPTAAGSATGSLLVVSTATNSPATVSLSGTGVGGT